MLNIKNVSKNYGNFTALKEISLQISEGKAFGLIGPNGAGKSTFMKILAGILTDYSGEILLNDVPLERGHGALKDVLGYVPQDICLEEDLTAKENLMFFGKIYGLTGQALKERCEKMIQWIGLEAHYNKKVCQFSGGMKRRLNIGCALLHNPRLVIMDEPTVGVDPQSRNYIFEMVQSMKNNGVTVIYCSHYMEEIEQLCDEIALIDFGEVLEEGTVSEIQEKYEKPFIYIEGECVEEDLEQFGTIHLNEPGYFIECENHLDTLGALTQYLKAQGLKVTRLEIAKPRLEDIFLNLTGKQLRDE